MSFLFKAVTASTVLSLFVSSVSLAFNGSENNPMQKQGMRGMGMHQGNQAGSCIAKMNLTKEQQDKIVALHKVFDPKHDAISTEMRNLHKQLRDLNISKAGSDKTNPVLEKITALRTEQQKLRTDMHAKMQTIITPEQLATCPNMGNCNGDAGSMKHRGW